MAASIWIFLAFTAFASGAVTTNKAVKHAQFHTHPFGNSENFSKLPQHAQDFLNKFGNKIIGGQPVEDFWQFSYQVSLQYIVDLEGKEFQHFCGGTLIASRVVLTAAHCLTSKHPVDNYIVKVGALNQSAPAEGLGKFIRIAEVKVHEDYNDDTHENDLGLILLAEAVDCAIIPASLPPPNPVLVTGQTNFVASGWGYLHENEEVTPQVLYYVEIPYMNNTECASKYNPYGIEITDTMVCAGVDEGGLDTCQGDSGGPLVLEHSREVIGITSFGIGCGEPDFPGVYTFVAKFVDWIRSNMLSFNLQGNSC